MTKKARAQTLKQWLEATFSKEFLEQAEKEYIKAQLEGKDYHIREQQIKIEEMIKIIEGLWMIADIARSASRKLWTAYKRGEVGPRYEYDQLINLFNKDTEEGHKMKSVYDLLGVDIEQLKKLGLW